MVRETLQWGPVSRSLPWSTASTSRGAQIGRTIGRYPEGRVENRRRLFAAPRTDLLPVGGAGEQRKRGGDHGRDVSPRYLNISAAWSEPNICAALWPTPGTSTNFQPKRQPRACAAALAFAKVLRPRSSRLRPCATASGSEERLCAPMSSRPMQCRDRQLEIGAQGLLRIGRSAEAIRHRVVHAGQHPGRGIGDHEVRGVGWREGRDPAQELPAGRVPDQRMRQGRSPGRSARPGDERADQVDRALARRHEGPVRCHAAPLIEIDGEALGIEFRRDDDRADPVGERSSVVAIGTGVAVEAVEHSEQKTGRPVGTPCEDIQRRAHHLCRMLAGARADDLSHGRPRRRGSTRTSSSCRGRCYSLPDRRVS